MIVKELDPFPSTDDPMLRAGRKVEEQMAYYLRRNFADQDEIAVFNGLRLERPQKDGVVIAAQIDHLIVHRAGFIIVESKSVSGTVTVNERGEWVRAWGRNERRGMASPVLQVQEQAKILRGLLNDNAEQLLGKILGIQQGRFGASPIDVLVAISDGGIFTAPKKVSFSEVCKADQVVMRIQERIAEHRSLASIFNLSALAAEKGRSINAEEFSKVTAFLKYAHRPLHPVAPPLQAVASVAVPSPPPILATLMSPPLIPLPSEPITSPPSETSRFYCRHCGKGELMILWGHSYYFRCLACNDNSPIDASVLRCVQCDAKRRVRKEGLKFYTECDVCEAAGRGKSSRLFFTNPRLMLLK